MKCSLKRELAAGKVALGTWITIAHPDVPGLLEKMGFDWLVLDTEHAPIGVESLAMMIQAVDAERVCPLVGGLAIWLQRPVSPSRFFRFPLAKGIALC